MAKRTRDNTLRAQWSKRERDVSFGWPSGPQTKADGHLLHSVFGVERYPPPSPLNRLPDPSLLKELERRGYDITTLCFSICKKVGHPRWKTADAALASKETDQ